MELLTWNGGKLTIQRSGLTQLKAQGYDVPRYPVRQHRGGREVDDGHPRRRRRLLSLRGLCGASRRSRSCGHFETLGKGGLCPRCGSLMFTETNPYWYEVRAPAALDVRSPAAGRARHLQASLLQCARRDRRWAGR